MRLFHYSKRPLTFERERRYEQTAEGFKPHGLWLSAELDDEESYGWREWCRGNDFVVDALACRAEFVLDPAANVMHLTSEHDLRVFTQKYRRAGAELTQYRSIDWTRLAVDYQGIVIAPYQWSCRLAYDLFWYYPWDCASGCIWDLSTLTQVVGVKERATR